MYNRNPSGLGPESLEVTELAFQGDASIYVEEPLDAILRIAERVGMQGERP
jgi:hypothetical protein